MSLSTTTTRPSPPTTRAPAPTAPTAAAPTAPAPTAAAPTASAPLASPDVYAPAPAAAAAKPDLRTEAQKKLDAFKDRYTPTYLVDGKAVSSPTPFRMNGGNNQGASEAEMKSAETTGAIKGPAPGVALARIERDLRAAKKWTPAMEASAKRVVWGRGSPEDCQKVTQALIDAGRLPPAISIGPGGAVTSRTPTERIRQLQWQYGIGVDCAGYVSQASPASQGKTPTQMGTDNVPNAPFGLLAPPSSHYAKQGAPLAKDGSLDVAPGDIVALSDPDPTEPGHFVTVYDKKTVDPSTLPKSTFLDGPSGKPASGVVAYQVDSSWGANGKPQEGGVERRTWLYNPETKRWADYDPKKSPPITPQPVGPYGHTVSAVYRPKA